MAYVIDGYVKYLQLVAETMDINKENVGWYWISPCRYTRPVWSGSTSGIYVSDIYIGKPSRCF
jgi:hypothetical protein